MCVHPEVAARAQQHENWRATLMDIAVENILRSERRGGGGGGGGGKEDGWRMTEGEVVWLVCRVLGVNVGGGMPVCAWPLCRHP